jgi:hypothetical protein
MAPGISVSMNRIQSAKNSRSLAMPFLRHDLILAGGPTARSLVSLGDPKPLEYKRPTLRRAQAHIEVQILFGAPLEGT